MRHDAILETELARQRAAADGDTAPTGVWGNARLRMQGAPPATRAEGTVPAPDVRRRYGPFRPTVVGNPEDGGFLHPKIEGAE